MTCIILFCHRQICREVARNQYSYVATLSLSAKVLLSYSNIANYSYVASYDTSYTYNEKNGWIV